MLAYWIVGGSDRRHPHIAIGLIVCDYRVCLCSNGEDIIDYFETLKTQEKLPSIENLMNSARILFYRYGHPRSFSNAQKGFFKDDKVRVPDGHTWVPHQKEMSSEHLQNSSTSKKKSKPDDSTTYDEAGDEPLARSTRLIYDLTISRDMTMATAIGHSGRLWEVMKVCSSACL
jgi:hypothetical protein